MITLMQALHAAKQRVDAAFENDSTLTSSQLMVLSAAAAMDGCSQTALVTNTNINRSTIADICRRLARDGFVTRDRSKSDERAREVRITPAGRTILSNAMRKADAIEAKLFERLTTTEAKCLMNALGKLAAAPTEKDRV